MRICPTTLVKIGNNPLKKKKRKENANEIFSLEEEQHRRDTRNPSKLKFPYELELLS